MSPSLPIYVRDASEPFSPLLAVRSYAQFFESFSPVWDINCAKDGFICESSSLNDVLDERSGFSPLERTRSMASVASDGKLVAGENYFLSDVSDTESYDDVTIDYGNFKTPLRSQSMNGNKSLTSGILCDGDVVENGSFGVSGRDRLSSQFQPFRSAALREYSSQNDPKDCATLTNNSTPTKDKNSDAAPSTSVVVDDVPDPVKPQKKSVGSRLKKAVTFLSPRKLFKKSKTAPMEENVPNSPESVPEPLPMPGVVGYVGNQELLRVLEDIDSRCSSFNSGGPLVRLISTTCTMRPILRKFLSNSLVERTQRVCYGRAEIEELFERVPELRKNTLEMHESLRKDRENLRNMVDGDGFKSTSGYIKTTKDDTVKPISLNFSKSGIETLNNLVVGQSTSTEFVPDDEVSIDNQNTSRLMTPSPGLDFSSVSLTMSTYTKDVSEFVVQKKMSIVEVSTEDIGLIESDVNEESTITSTEMSPVTQSESCPKNESGEAVVGLSQDQKENWFFYTTGLCAHPNKYRYEVKKYAQRRYKYTYSFSLAKVASSANCLSGHAYLKRFGILPSSPVTCNTSNAKLPEKDTSLASDIHQVYNESLSPKSKAPEDSN